MFFTRLNLVQTISRSAIQIATTMSSVESPYFNVECQTATDEMLMLPSTGTRQTRSTAKSKALKIKVETDVSELLNVKAKKSRKNAVKKEENSEWVPEHWEAVLDNIRTMRAARDAPVDQMGAEKCTDTDISPEVKRFQVLVSLMLSSQTRDQVTFAAMEKLKGHGLTIDNIINTEEETIANLIYPVGFWKRKASYIKRTAAILKENYNSDIPRTVEELCKLPGVGQKMAVLTVNIGWEETVGIGVDTHVHRIANRLGWTRSPTKTPEQTQKELEDWIPRPLWDEVNVLLVGFGQQTCTPVGPHCSTCLNKTICPFAKSSPIRKR